MLSPSDEHELAACLAGRDRPVEILGAGSKRSVGALVDAEPLSVASLSGVLDYHPEELVLTARAATPLAEVRALLAASGQRLAFEPCDLGPLLGAPCGVQTLGGILGANLSGSRRVTAGAARDHFLGCRAVNGRGEIFKAGGKVVKNVTGYDLPKLFAGSWGTLAVLTEVTLRAVPAAQYECTLCVATDEVDTALRMMTAALGSAHEVSAAAYDPVQGQVLLRLEGFAPSVAARRVSLGDELHALFAGREFARLEGAPSRQRWDCMGSVEALAAEPVVWRVAVPPSDAVRVLRELRPERYLLDWGGGLIWLGAVAPDAPQVRDVLRAGSHATLIKAPREARATGVFQPLSAPLAALTQALRRAFDPQGLLNPGRMG